MILDCRDVASEKLVLGRNALVCFSFNPFTATRTYLVCPVLDDKYAIRTY